MRRAQRLSATAIAKQLGCSRGAIYEAMSAGSSRTSSRSIANTPNTKPVQELYTRQVHSVEADACAFYVNLNTEPNIIRYRRCRPSRDARPTNQAGEICR
ncbi:hypothetical protein [Bradyrhizobium sp. 144]|uniref:hypothetical protein n=1 Tax=Bradyrhizobium sp. 144 TaxID=2782620 RepID=UPI0031FF3A35